MNLLEEIRPSLERMMDSIAIALRTELAIFDNNANLFYCTPTYLKKKGKAVHAPFIQEVLDMGSVIVNKPGEMPSCIGCRFKDNCPSTVEILSCIKMQGQTLGVVSITSFTKEGHNRISSNLDSYQDTITEISYLIGNMVLNKSGSTMSTTMEKLIEGTLNMSQSPMMLCDANGVITAFNEHAVQMLSFCKLSTASLMSIIPKDCVEMILNGASLHEKDFIFTGYRGKLSSNVVKLEDRVVGIIVKITDISYIDTKIETIKRLIGSTPEAEHIHHMIKRLASSPTPVLITGETGTGKELTARSIHQQGKRSSYPFIAVNCAGIPETLFESELFGYEEGSFTGAKKGGKIGKIEMAQGGTLFLDEIADMPMSIQPKLLRVLQEYELERVGSSKKIPLNIRVIAATNGNLPKLIEEGKFREDLYYRIAVINLELPPLRRRTKDILPIARNYLEQLKSRLSTPAVDFSPEVIQLFENCRWKGNVRELQNIVEYAANMTDSTMIQLCDLPPKMLNQSQESADLNDTKAEKQNIEFAEIKKLLDKYGSTLNGKKKIAASLGISLRTLYRRLDKMNIPR